MNLISLKTELRQELKLTPQLLQSMEVLQMNSQELLDYLGKISEENPTLELSEASELRSAYAELRQKASWLDAGTFGTSFAHEEDGPPEPGATDKELDSLSAFLCDQLERKRLPKPLLALCKYMAELVDEDGYLTQEDLDGLTEMKIPQTMVDQALDTIQSLEPAGVGARDLSECLVLQLSRRKDNVPYAMDIAARFLTELSRSHYGPITKALGASISEIQAAEKAIAALDPHPGQAFQPAEPTLYVRPDVFVVELEGELQVLLNEYYLPKVTVNPYYSSMAKESDDPEARTYLKEKLRQTIRKALATATSFDEFSSLLLREGVTVKESRGRLSYLTPDRTKPITARKLGDDFDRAAVFAVLEQNAARATEKAAAIPEYPRHGKNGIQPTKAPQTAPKQDGVQRLVDIEQKMAEGKGRGYEHWAKIHNLKQAAKTLNVYQQYGFTSPEQLEAAVDTAYQEMRQTSGKLKTLETKLQGKKELQRQVLAYAKTKPTREGLRAQKSEKARAAYRQANESDFIIAEAAARYFKAHGITKLPARKALQAEIEQLISEKDGLYNTYHEQKQQFKELQTVKRNIDQILRREEPHRRKEQSHER